jgi:hypothetical protein
MNAAYMAVVSFFGRDRPFRNPAHTSESSAKEVELGRTTTTSVVVAFPS